MSHAIAASLGMRAAKIICLLVIAVTTLHFLLAFAQAGIGHGAGMDVFLAGYRCDPWQAVINVDLMVGLLLAASWIYWREPDRAVALTWIVVLFWWGNLILAIYAWRQLRRSDGSWTRFFLGVHAADALPPPSHAPWPLAVRALLYAAALVILAVIVAGCRAAWFAAVPMIGYVWGLGCFLLVFVLIAQKGRAVHE